MTGALTIVAEAGINHDGRPDRAHQLIDVAADAGADAVKFQTFSAGSLSSKSAGLAAYQVDSMQNADSQLSMLAQLELPRDAYPGLVDHCRRRGIEFMSTPFSADDLTFLSGLGMRRVKVSSGELTNLPLLADIARTGMPVILSTGMATLAEVEDAVTTLRSNDAGETMLLHCLTDYPADPGEANLQAMVTMRDHFGLAVGYSDHTTGVVVAIAAVALGASMIEKHFTWDRTAKGPDHKASLEPADLTAFVRDLRLVETALGDGRKRPAPSEYEYRIQVRRSLVAARPLAAGTVVSPEDLCIKRPGNGIAPKHLAETIGRTLARAVEADQVLTEDMLK